MLCGCPVSAVTAVSSDALEPSGLLSPGSTVRSLTKELQHSLDLASATSGDKVVTAQVSEALTYFWCLQSDAYLLIYIWCKNLYLIHLNFS